MKKKREGNFWRMTAAFVFSIVLILDGLPPAWSASAGPESLAGRSYEDAEYAGPYGLARFVSGNGAANLEGLLFNVLGDGRIMGGEPGQEAGEDAQDISGALDETASQMLISAGSTDSAALEMLGWTEDTEMSQRLVGSWGTGADEIDNEYFWPELYGFEGEWLELPDDMEEPLDAMEDEWWDDDREDQDRADGWREGAELEGNDLWSDRSEEQGYIEDGDIDNGGMPVWKVHSHTQERESRRGIILYIDKESHSAGFDGGDGGFFDAGSVEGAGGHDGDSDLGSDGSSGNGGDDQGNEDSSGNDGNHGDGEGLGEDNGGSSGNSGEEPENPDENDGGDGTGDGDNEDQDKDPDDEDDTEGTDPGDESGGDGEEKGDEEEGESDEEQEQEDPVQEEPVLYISPEGVWDGSIAESFAGGTGTASDPYLISNGAELAYLAQQVNSGTNYSGKYFLQTADIILNQYVPGLNSVQESESVAEDEGYDGEQEADPQREDRGDGLEVEGDGSVASEDAGSDEASRQNGEAENDAQIFRAVSSVVVVPEGEGVTGGDENKTESGSDEESNDDSEEAEDKSSLEEGSDSEGQENKEGPQAYSLRTSNEPIAWTPIGYSSSRSFRGTYDGDNYEISGIYIDTTKDYQGLFGYASGTLKNIHIINSKISGGSYVGGIAGHVSGDVSGSRNAGDVEAAGEYAGGLVGEHMSGNMTDGINKGSVSAAEGYAGGIAGYYSRGILEGCENLGDVQSRGAYAGGIVGRAVTGSAASNAAVQIRRSINRGDVRGTKSVGGILGYGHYFNATTFVEIEECINEGGRVYGDGDYVGGIAGYAGGRIADSRSNAAVYGGSYVGGIAGYIAGTAAGCENYGRVEGLDYTGGIAGWTKGIAASLNEGDVSGASRVGGLAGHVSGDVSGSRNAGDIEAAGEYAGGLVGEHISGNMTDGINEGSVSGEGDSVGGLAGYYVKGILEGCENLGDVQGEGSYTGGLVGRAVTGSAASNAAVQIRRSINRGDVRGGRYTGGILGYGRYFNATTFADIEECLNEGSLVYGDGDYVGGIAGYAGGRIADSRSDAAVYGGSYVGGAAGYARSVEGHINRADVQASGSYAGGIAGYIVGAAAGCENYGRVEGLDHTGGIAGRAGGIADSLNEGDVSGASRVGGLAGHASGDVSGSRNAGDVEAAGEYAGGLVGEHMSGNMTDGINEGSVSGEGDSVGGLAGYYVRGILEGCENLGDVQGEGSYTGGLVGRAVTGSAASNAAVQIRRSINRGDVRGGRYTGGILGYGRYFNATTFADIEECLNEGSLVYGDGDYVGGIAGYAGGRIADSRSDAAVYGGSYVGGAAGYARSVEGHINRADVQASGSYAGGIAGYIVGAAAGCENYGRVEGLDHTGGIAGWAGGIADSLNEGDVSGASRVGGLAGHASGDVSGSRNAGDVEAAGEYAGGLVGEHTSGNMTDGINEGSVSGAGGSVGGLAGYYVRGILEGCENLGDVQGEGSYTGGLVGRAVTGSAASNAAVQIRRSINRGDVRGGRYTGGILGYGRYFNATTFADIEECLNEGSLVYGDGDYVGGIAGYAGGRIADSRSDADVYGRSYVSGVAGYTAQNIDGCINHGDVHASEGYAGGIAGSTQTAVNCENYGTVSGKDSIGGIAGTVTKSLSDCTNSGAVNGTGTGTGGIVGRLSNSGAYISDSTNTVTVRGNNSVGGIIGEAGRSDNTVLNCDNTGSHVSGSGSYVGGIAGYTIGDIINGINSANIHAEGSYAGGIAGFTEKDITGYINYVNVHASESHAGGIAGSMGIAENCTNYGFITGGSYIGGIAGFTLGIAESTNYANLVKGNGDYIGGIAGYAVGSITDSSSSASVEGKNRVGGIAGELYNGKVISTENTGSQVTGIEDYVGGIAGSIRGTSEISDSINQAEVAGRDHTGGVTGGTPDSSGKNAVIADSSTEGSVSGRDRVGGIAGSFQGTISSSQVNGSITGVNYLGGIAGDSSGIIQECTNETILSGSDYVGGIAGRAGSVSMSSNEASISGGNYIGGIAGTATGVITGSQNKAQINGSGDYTGGIAGYTTKELISSRSEGEIIGHNYVGGIAGYANKISDYTNEADVIGTGVRVGGIAGQVNILEKCLNKGTVTGGTEAAGGLAGTVTGSVTDGYNYGRVSSSGIKVGGIVGEHTGSTLDNCVNLETVSGESYVGGVAGWSSGTINSSWNTASVRALSDVAGGIAGYSSRAINDSHNKGAVSGNGLSTGGIAGYQSGTVTTSRNMGTVSGVEAVGGVVGFKQSGTIDRSLNTGLIIYSELDAGGVAGKINGSTIVDCYNLGQITGRGDQAGGIVGGSYSSGQIRNTYNTGRVSADMYRGGIIGYDNYRNPVMKNNYYVIGTAAQGIGSSEEDDDHDLSELFMRVSSSELQGMAYRLGSSYHNDIMNSNQGYPLLRDVNYANLEIPSDVTFGLYTLGRGDISILVSEKQNPNAAKEGASVALSGFESDETNDQGLVVFHDPSPTSGIDRKALTVQLDGYRLYYGGIDIIRDQSAAALYDTNQFLAMLTPLKADDTAKPYISTLMHYSRNDSTQDTLTSMVSVLKNTQTELHMYAVWNGKQPQKYILFQKSGGRLESGSGVFNTNLTDTFVPGETIYAQVIASDETESDIEETLLQVLNVKAPSFIDFFRGAEIKLPGEKIPFFQGMINPKLTKIPIQVKIDNTKIRVAIGKEYSENELNEKEWDEWSKKWSRLTDDYPQKLQSISSKWMDALVVSAKVAGYAEARFSDMDYSALYELEAGAAWELKGELSRTMVRPIGYIPVYVKLTGGVDGKGQGYHTFNFIGEETPLLNLGGEFVIKGMGEMGVGIPKVVTAGVEGKLSFPLEYAGGVIKRIYGKGALTFKASAFGFSYDKLIGSPVELIEIYPKPGLLPDRLMLDTAALYDTAEYKPTSLDYTLNGSQWYGGGLQAEAVALAADLIAPASTVITGETLLQTNINQDSKPQIVAVGDTYAAVWIVNNAERGGSHPNWTMLVYSVYDPASGTWSEPVPVDDDGTADFNPSLKAGGGRLYVAWQNANQVFEEEDLTLEAFIAASEIAAAEFDPVSRKFGPVRRITENNSLDMTPALAVSNQGAASVVWLTNSENDIFGMTGSTAVMAYNFAGGGTNVLKDGLGPVSSLDAAYINGILTAAYSLDRDGDLSTLEDQEIYMVTTGAEPVRVTDNDVIDSNPTFGKYKDQNALFFYSEGKLLARLENGDIETIFEEEAEEVWVMDEDGELYVPETGLLTDDFQVMTSANGHTAVIWTKIQEDESRQVEGILYNKDSGQWSREVKISDSQADVMHPSGVILPDGTMKILYSRYTVGQEWGDYGQSDLCLMDLAPSYDLAVEGVYYDSSDMVPGSEIEISVLVKNNGYLPVEQIQLRIGEQETVHEVYLLPGESGVVQALYQLPGTIDLETLALQVSVPGESDITPLDNLAEITWGHADASLQLQELVNAHGQVANIKVSNHSYKDTRGEMVVRINGIDGQIYEVIDLGTLTNDAVKVLSYGITDEIRRIPGIESLYFIVETDQEELYESNNYDYININWYR